MDNKNKIRKIITQKQILEKHYRFLRQSDSEENDEQQRISNKQKQRERSRQKKCNILSEQDNHHKYGQNMAKKYEDKLYKQFALVDLSRYQTGQIGCRWRTERQVKRQKGQKFCGQVNCSSRAKLVYEMNFGYIEQNKKKNALVKVSVCSECQVKLNFKKQLKKYVQKVKYEQEDQIEEVNKQQQEA